MKHKRSIKVILFLICISTVVWGMNRLNNIKQQNISNSSMDDSGSMNTSEVKHDKIVNNPDSKMTSLENVSTLDASGTAYILRSDMLNHSVTANLPDPDDGSVYEGWLVRKTPTLAFFSTGVMDKNSEGEYQLMYESTDLYSEYQDVVITLETKVDETPEDHILEGTFE